MPASISTVTKYAPSNHVDNTYGDDRDRTGDPLLAKQVLSQLSYAPELVVN